MNKQEIETMIAGRKLHHSALRQGYVSRKIAGTASVYKGRFGEGIIILRPNFNSTRYCIVEYYI